MTHSDGGSECEAGLILHFNSKALLNFTTQATHTQGGQAAVKDRIKSRIFHSSAGHDFIITFGCTYIHTYLHTEALVPSSLVLDWLTYFFCVLVCSIPPFRGLPAIASWEWERDLNRDWGTPSSLSVFKLPSSQTTIIFVFLSQLSTLARSPGWLNDWIRGSMHAGCM